MKKKYLTTALLFLLLICFLYLISALHTLFRTPLVKNGVSTSIKVYPAEQSQTLSERLYQQGLIHDRHLFEWLINISGNRFNLRYGEYRIRYPITAWILLQHIVNGTDLVKHRLTLVNGWTFSQVLGALTSNSNLKQTLQGKTNQQILKMLGATQTHPEGLFYPDTYFFTWGNTDLSVLKTAYDKMQNILASDWKDRAPNLPYQTPYQALIVASLIEKETSVDSEKPLIASVIINRLAKNMRLQIDPTVQYGLDKSFGGPITKDELKTKTPYNTYVITGLPPTPICIPSQSSIQAALHPATTDYLYYVATGKGGHNFSKTYAEHLVQVNVYKKTLMDKTQ